jgi:heme A synthase
MRIIMGLPLDLLWLTIPAYVVMQVVAMMRSSGGSRMAATLPLFVMVPVFVHAAVGLVQESNLWPLLMLFVSPAALLYVTVVAFLPRRSRTPEAR